METSEFTGRCHCGNIRYRFTTTQASDSLPLRRCDCSFCRRHGAVYTSDPSGELVLEVKVPEALKKYRFSSGVVDFLICGNCGVLTAAVAEIDDHLYGVVVTNSMDEPIVRTPEEKKFTDESVQEGLARRKRHWIGKVTVNY